MRWDTVIRAAMATVQADPILAGIYGDAIRLLGTSSPKTPVLELMLVSDTETELWSPVVLQFDQWVNNSADLRESERRLRQLFHLEVPEPIAGIVMWSQYIDGDPIGTPNRDGFLGRAIRFQLTPLRERYDASVV